MPTGHEQCWVHGQLTFTKNSPIYKLWCSSRSTNVKEEPQKQPQSSSLERFCQGAGGGRRRRGGTVDYVLTPWRSPEGLHFIHPGAWIQVFLEEKKHVKVLIKVWLKPQPNAPVTEDVCSQTGRLSDGLWGSVQLTVSDILHHRCCSCYWISFYCVQYCKYELGRQIDAAYLNESGQRVLKSQLKCFHSQFTDTAQN